MAASPDRKKLDHGRVWVMLSDNERVDHLERQSMQNQATRDRALKAMGLMDDTAPRGPMDGPGERPQDTAARDKAMRLLRGDFELEPGAAADKHLDEWLGSISPGVQAVAGRGSHSSSSRVVVVVAGLRHMAPCQSLSTARPTLSAAASSRRPRC